jgi:hypothetical protein
MLLKRISRLNVFQFIRLICIITLGLITFIGCGGGGGDSTPASPAITYTGLITQANITDTNAQTLSAGAFQGGRTGSVLSGTGAVEIGTDENPISFRALKVTQALENSLFQVDLSSISSGPFIGATQSESGSGSGACGGTASYFIQYNDQTGVFSGNFTFSSYCEAGVTLSGSASFSGSLDLSDPNNPIFEGITFTFTNMSDGNSTLNGTIDIDLSSSPNIVTFDALLKDDVTGKVYWVKDYDMSITEGVDGTGYYVDLDILSGTYYDPDYGYITVETTTPIRAYDINEWPSSGVIVVTGNNNKKVRLSVIDEIQCQIDADLDGDGSYEWGPVVKNWADL